MGGEIRACPETLYLGLKGYLSSMGLYPQSTEFCCYVQGEDVVAERIQQVTEDLLRMGCTRFRGLWEFRERFFSLSLINGNARMRGIGLKSTPLEVPLRVQGNLEAGEWGDPLSTEGIPAVSKEEGHSLLRALALEPSFAYIRVKQGQFLIAFQKNSEDGDSRSQQEQLEDLMRRTILTTQSRHLAESQRILIFSFLGQTEDSWLLWTAFPVPDPKK